jgi:hypothetical protein
MMISWIRPISAPGGLGAVSSGVETVFWLATIRLDRHLANGWTRPPPIVALLLHNKNQMGGLGMKQIILAAASTLAPTPAQAQYTGSYGTGSKPNSHPVQGHVTSNGTYVAPSVATNPNSTQRDNYGATGNVNPYTGAVGNRNPRYCFDAHVWLDDRRNDRRRRVHRPSVGAPAPLPPDR